MSQKLTTTDHDRNIADLKYIYPVISRRAGGLSIGINFNTNNACNWRCIYCQVPDLSRGTAPRMDFALLASELRFFLEKVSTGDFFDQYSIPKQQRIIRDIAISGNGEPTSLKHFDKAVALIGQIATDMKILPKCDFVLITNGSLINQSTVQAGLRILNDYKGVIWYKFDSATANGRKKINNTNQTNNKTLKNLKIATSLCKTNIQTCMLQYSTPSRADNEYNAYLEALNEIKKNRIKVNKVMLYSLARPSLQPEAKQLGKLDKDTMIAFSNKIKAIGYDVSVN